jgi:AraC-like DNA-binding protein
MRYAEFPPPAALAPYVRCIWIFEAEYAAGEPATRIVPDGRCEFIVHRGDAYVESGIDGIESEQPRALFAGQLSRPLWLRQTGRADVIGVRFHPAGARRFFGAPLTQATDRRVEIRGFVDSRDVTAATNFVAARIESTPDGSDPAIERCAALVEQRHGQATIEEMVEASGLGRRQLERRFRDAVGLSPRLFANVLRLRSVFDAMQPDSHTSWSEAAQAVGYFDQSHLIRDFRRFVGCTPAQFLAAPRGLAAAIVEEPA